MICDRCGAKLDNDAEYCWACGNKVEVKMDDDIEGSLLEKYKNNISFFSLSDDNSVKRDEEANDEITNPFVFPNNLFTDMKNNETSFTRNNNFDNNEDVLDQAETIEPLINSSILPDNSLPKNNIGTGLTDETLTNPSIFPDSSLSENNIKSDDSPSLNNGIIDAPIFPENSIQNTNPIVNEPVSNVQSNQNVTAEDNTEAKIEEPIEKDKTKKEKKKSNNSLIVFVALAFIILIILSVIFTGNDLKHITCVQTETDNGLTSETTLNATFKNSKIKSLTVNGNYVVDDTYMNYMENFYESVKNELQKYSDLEGTEVTTDSNNNTITYSVTSTDANNLFKIVLDADSETSQDFTNAAEEQGYRCTIDKN